MTKVLPIGHLRPATQEWVKDCRRDFEFEQHHDHLLVMAGEIWDRRQQAMDAIAVHGLTYIDNYGVPRPRPEISIEQRCWTAFARILRELDLDTEGPKESSARPPLLRSNRRLSGLKAV